MDRVTITPDPIAVADFSSLLCRDHCCGAQEVFLGVVRKTNEGKQVSAIEYECYVEMARGEGLKIVQEAQGLWPVHHVFMVHRIGKVLVGEPSLFVGVSSPHRGEAFRALEYMVEEIKKRLPIWKKETPLAHP